MYPCIRLCMYPHIYINYIYVYIYKVYKNICIHRNMYVYMHWYMNLQSTYVYTFVGKFECMCVLSIYLCIHVSMILCIPVSMFVCLHTCIVYGCCTAIYMNVFMYKKLFVCMYVCMYKCIHLCLCVYVNIYKSIHGYMCIHKCGRENTLDNLFSPYINESIQNWAFSMQLLVKNEYWCKRPD